VPAAGYVRDGGDSAGFKLRYSFQGFQLVQLKEKITGIFFKRKPKKESFISSGRMQRCKGGEVRAVYIPLHLCQPGTYLCFSFIGFCSWFYSLSTADYWYWCEGKKQEKQP